MKNILILIAIFVFVSCEMSNLSTSIERAIDLSISDTAGNDLLDPDSNDSLAIEEYGIRIYYVLNGEKTYVFDIEGIKNRCYQIYYDTYRDKYKLTIFLNDSKSENLPATIIDWGNTSKSDTISCQYSYSGNSVFMEKVWFNGKETFSTEYIDVIQ